MVFHTVFLFVVDCRDGEMMILRTSEPLYHLCNRLQISHFLLQLYDYEVCHSEIFSHKKSAAHSCEFFATALCLDYMYWELPLLLAVYSLFDVWI